VIAWGEDHSDIWWQRDREIAAMQIALGFL